MSPAELRTWLESLAEVYATIPAEEVIRRLPPAESEVSPPPPGPVEVSAASWRERLWTVPAETRLGLEEVCEAIGRSPSWIYHRTSAKAENLLLYRKLDGTLVFTAGEVRAWSRGQEEVVHAGPMGSPRLRAASVQ